MSYRGCSYGNHLNGLGGKGKWEVGQPPMKNQQKVPEEKEIVADKTMGLLHTIPSLQANSKILSFPFHFSLLQDLHPFFLLYFKSLL